MTDENKQPNEDRADVIERLAEAMKGAPVEDIAHHMVGSFIAANGNLNQTKADFIVFLEAFKARVLQDYGYEGGQFTHHRRGGNYRRFAKAAGVRSSRPITEGDTVTVYVSQDLKVWVRPQEEFEDGRFCDPHGDIPQYDTKEGR